ncbi:hypothetical protein Nwi_1620 [Nitrobacter winogradskyi Nb-255]|uniref:DUF3168 domain-containing protein n=1 Tax=Nitrobacter winogradskyi (strain ATCC 25391 / DSM 10237 / CIP 104748 / NCIMB 11846 / Nb-255) TaxID=323098 RepID=Q3SS60_NITWN|nr:DUF3168 domain-containing protein [Nitrobacter winogradskyi]ABA04881.1 hypothetical protein Nwi_1620 [Nitrobacter winogradskyi Nb-255]
MSSPALALQKAIRLRLINTAAVTALVPAANILDRNERPAPSPSIILGEDQEVDEDFTLKRDYIRVYSTLHIWKTEPSTAGVKAIAGAVRKAIGRVRRLDIGDPDFVCADCRVDGVRYLRDPGGEMSHAVLTINSLVQARWSVVI